MRKRLLILFIIFSWNLSHSQTSIHTEIVSSFQPSNYYLLENGQAKSIAVKIINNPNDDKYTDEWIYNYESEKEVSAKLYRDEALLKTRNFELDSTNRVIFEKSSFKHKAMGWERKNMRYVYGRLSKELQFLSNNGDIKYRMLVQYDSLNLPVRITSMNDKGMMDGLSIAKYDYQKGKYRYVVFKNDNSIVLDKIEYFNPDYVISKNENGDVTEMYWPTAIKGSNVIHKLEYKYDKLGNWTRLKKTLFTPERKKVLAIVTRKIKYNN